jgi:diacylglycerol kinase (ATP)
MLTSNDVPNLLFIINPSSGSNNTNWSEVISNYFRDKAVNAIVHLLPKNSNLQQLKDTIKAGQPGKVIAVGGDGTVKLVAAALMGSNIPLGIFPAGSANGMAKEFDITGDAAAILNVIENGEQKKIHLVKVNDEICIHLSDIGFNAFVVKKFEEENTRGMWGYIKAAWKVLWQHSRMEVNIKSDGEFIKRQAAMVVIANGTKYGNGVVINPKGTLYDHFFEVVILRQISFAEIFKMRFFSNRLDNRKTELLQTAHLVLTSRRNLHFQVDGEYLGKTKKLVAEIIPEAIIVMVPAANK